MLISHTLVAWIQVAGLIISLYGFFYLSLGLFPPTDVSLFRPLLPATGAAILGFVFGRIIEIFPDALGLPFPTPPLILGAISYVVGYVISLRTQPKKERQGGVVQGDASGWPWKTAILNSSLLVVLIAAWIVRDLVNPKVLTTTLLQIPLTILFVVGVSTPRFLAIRLSERRLQIVGFVFSVTGIVTGFLPAVLEAANITVK